MNGDLKQTFIVNCLREYMESVMEGIRLQAKRQGVGITDEGINSLAYTAIQQGTGALGRLSFKEYLRFVDMGVGKGQKIGGIAAMRSTLDAKRGKKTKGRKAKKIYSKTAYGKLSWLQGKLLYGFTEEAISAIKNAQN